MSDRPGVVFAAQFVLSDAANVAGVVYSDHAIGYLGRADAAEKTYNDTEKYSVHALGYLGRNNASKLFHQTTTEQGHRIAFGFQNDENEKSAGIFTALQDFVANQERNEIAQQFDLSQGKGCPLYTTVISFDNDFLVKNGIEYHSAEGQAKLREYTRVGIANLIKNSQFDPGNVTYTAAIHYNTDNIHIHIDLVELKKINREKDMLPVKALDALKSAVANKIADNQYTVVLSEALRKNLLIGLKDAAKADTSKLDELYHLLPEAIQWQYNRKGMEAYQSRINQTVDQIIQSTPALAAAWRDTMVQLDRYEAFLSDLYGEGERHRAHSAVKHKLRDFYERAGNALLGELSELRRMEQEESYKTGSAASPTEREKNEMPPVTDQPDEIPLNTSWLEEKAEHGDPAALYKLGQMVEHGDGYRYAPELAATLYAAAAKRGSAGAAYRLGYLYEQNADLQNFEQSCKWYRAAAAVDHAAAQYRLGRLLQYGKLGTADISQASVWYQKAAFENPMAILQLLEMNRFGQIALTDMEIHDYERAAFTLFSRQCDIDENNAFAQYQLGKCCRYGIGTEPDQCDAVYHLMQAHLQLYTPARTELIMLAKNEAICHGLQVAADEGDRRAVAALTLLQGWQSKTPPPYAKNDQAFRSAQLQLRAGDYEKAIPALQDCMNAGNMLAVYELGRMYQYGLGVPADRSMANELYAAALTGLQKIEKLKPNSYNAYRIGKMYLYGQGTDPDPEQAATWYKKAAVQGNQFAKLSLANLYYYGTGVAQSYESAVKWYREAAEQDNPYAQYRLGEMAEAGQGMPADQQASEEYYSKAYIGFVAAATESLEDTLQYRAGMMTLKGQGITADPAAAAKWLQLSADQGNAHAQVDLARLYLAGSGVEQSADKAMTLLKAAAEQKYTPAQVSLGIYYLRQKQPELAAPYLRAAANQGNEFARQILQDQQQRREAAALTPMQQKAQSVIHNYRHSSRLQRSLRRMQSEYEGHIHRLKAEFEYEQDLQIQQAQNQSQGL